MCTCTQNNSLHGMVILTTQNMFRLMDIWKCSQFYGIQGSWARSSIRARSHTFINIDHKIISMVILLLSADSRRVVVSYKHFKYVHLVLINCIIKLAQEKSVVRWPDRSTLEDGGTQLLSGRVLNSRPRGCRFEPHGHHSVVSLPKFLFFRYVLLHHVMGEIEGVKGAWGYVEGGMGSVSRAIANCASDHGASIFTDKVNIIQHVHLNIIIIIYGVTSGSKLHRFHILCISFCCTLLSLCIRQTRKRVLVQTGKTQIKCSIMLHFIKVSTVNKREHSGSVVECLTQVGASCASVCCVLEQDTFILT